MARTIFIVCGGAVSHVHLRRIGFADIYLHTIKEKIIFDCIKFAQQWII